MNGEKRRDERTCPHLVGTDRWAVRCFRRARRSRPTIYREFAQCEEQQDNRCGVKRDVSQMMSPRLKPVKLAVQHMRDRGERVPVGRVNMGAGPLNIAWG